MTGGLDGFFARLLQPEDPIETAEREEAHQTILTRPPERGTGSKFYPASPPNFAGTASAKTADYTTTNSDGIIPVDATAGAITITLHTGPNRIQLLLIKKTDATGNVVTISGTIDGSATTRTMMTDNQSLFLAWDPTNQTWEVLNRRAPGQFCDVTSPTVATGETRFYNPFAGINSTSEAGSAQVATVRALAVSTIMIKPSTNALIAGESMVFTLRKNGADTGITLTIDNNSNSGTFVSSTGDPVEFAAGDRIGIKSVASALGASRSMTFVIITGVLYQ